MFKPVTPKVDFVETKLCYGPELTISGSDLKDKVGIGPSFSEFLDLEVTKEKGQSCLKMVIVADKPDEKLGKGMVNVARVKFNAIKDGSGKIIVDLSGTKRSGSNPDRESRDMAMQLGAVGEVNYIVGTGVAKKECQFWNIFCWIGRMFGN